ncbi:hypothetical protein Pcinc_006635 [Petrolisthes cinctipes]|uniref:CUB domain-containing protein n=1 Tax=Petrolisthes cinctipes TaxID=88211 RepID=A0AAE1GB20_PETCI|nr:hypothetical protein Pcinc_006635 [Petrolisthes cinctipes]
MKRPTCGVLMGELLKVVLLLTAVGVSPGVMGDCGGTYLDAKGTITSPGYPNNYPMNQLCVYTIKASPDTRIKFWCEEMKLQESVGCTKDWLMVNGVYVCGKTKLRDVYGQGELKVEFRSDNKIKAPGFLCHYERVTGTDYEEQLTNTLTASSTTGLRYDAPCECAKVIQKNEWRGNFQSDLVITVPKATTSWSICLRFSQPISNLRVWIANPSTTTGRTVTLTNKSYNGNQAQGSILKIDFIVSYTGVKPAVTSLTFNGSPLCLQ